MKEALQCKECGKSWSRERTRGKKPTVGPCCTNRTQERVAAITRPIEHTVVVAQGLTPEERADRLTSMMAPLHRLKRSDRQAQLDKIMQARDYGKRNEKRS